MSVIKRETDRGAVFKEREELKRRYYDRFKK